MAMSVGKSSPSVASRRPPTTGMSPESRSERVDWWWTPWADDTFLITRAESSTKVLITSDCHIIAEMRDQATNLPEIFTFSWEVRDELRRC